MEAYIDQDWNFHWFQHGGYGRSNPARVRLFLVLLLLPEKLATNEEINIIRLKQEDVLNDKNDWQNIFERFVTRKKEDNEEIEIIQGYKTQGGV